MYMGTYVCTCVHSVGHLFLRAKNFADGLKRKFEETIFTILHWYLLFSL